MTKALEVSIALGDWLEVSDSKLSALSSFFAKLQRFLVELHPL